MHPAPARRHRRSSSPCCSFFADKGRDYRRNAVAFLVSVATMPRQAKLCVAVAFVSGFLLATSVNWIRTNGISAAIPESFGTWASGFRTSEKGISTAGSSGGVVNQLLSPPMDLMRRGIPISTAYNATVRQFTGQCSCLDPRASTACCQRRFRRAHKMGCLLTQHMWDTFKPYIRKTSDPPQYTYHVSGPPSLDYRDVYLFRDLYDSIVSGFLYHQMGRECWTNPYGGPLRNDTAVQGGMPQVREWQRGLFSPDLPPYKGRSLCDYLKEVSEEVGMRAYIEFIFRVHYSGPFAHWAMSEELPELAERTRVVCFDDLRTPDRDLETINWMLDFYYNGTDHKEFKGRQPSKSAARGHQTSHNPALRARLADMVKRIDETYYDGQIAWVHSVLPCQNRSATR